jgi:hypothetical protein
MLQNHIQNRSNNAGKQNRKRGGASQTPQDPIDIDANSIPLLENGGPEAQVQLVQQQSPGPAAAIQGPSPGGKRKAPQDGEELEPEVGDDEGGGKPPSKKTKTGGGGGRTAELASFNSALALSGGTSRTESQNPAPDSKVSISHIQVDASCTFVRFSFP